MIYLFWLAIFLIFYSYFGYPLILMILGLFKSKKINKGEIAPLITLFISAYNEEEIIRKKIENSLNLDYPKDKLEIVVASESDDNTNNIMKEYEGRGIKLFAYSGREGKQFTTYRTIPKCSGEIIVFSDANAIYKKDALKKLSRNFNDFQIGCVSGELKYINPRKVAIGESEGLYWKYEVFIKNLESKIQSVLGANGSIYAIRKKLYRPLSKYRGDDFELPIRIAQQGYGVVWEPEAISQEEVSPGTKEEFRRKVRISAWAWQSSLVLLKNSLRKFQLLLVFQLISHKILRWLVGFFLILIFFSNLFLLNIPFYLILFILQIVFYSLAIFAYIRDRQGKKTTKITNLAYYFSMVNLACIIGVWRGIFCKQKPTWEKVR